MPRPPKMSREEAEKILELSGSYTYQDYKKAYRRLIAKYHPDAGNSNTEEMSKQLNLAKTTMEWLFSDDKTATFTVGEAPASSSSDASYSSASTTSTSTQAGANESWANDYERRQAERRQWEEEQKAQEANRQQERPAPERPRAENIPRNEPPEPTPTASPGQKMAHEYVQWASKTRDYAETCSVDGEKIPAASSDWKGNVGVPFAYAATDDEEDWRRMNEDASLLYEARRRPAITTRIEDFIESRFTLCSWLFVVLMWVLSAYVIPPIAFGYSPFDPGWTEAAKQTVTDAQTLIVYGLTYPIPILAIIFRKKVMRALISLCQQLRVMSLNTTMRTKTLIFDPLRGEPEVFIPEVGRGAAKARFQFMKKAHADNGNAPMQWGADQWEQYARAQGVNLSEFV